MKAVVNFFAYIAIMFAAVALTLGSFWKDVAVLRNIAEVIAYVIAGISAFYFARSKQKPVYMICFIVAVCVIIAMLILNIVRL